jgi:hypothetical protein
MLSTNNQDQMTPGHRAVLSNHFLAVSAGGKHQKYNLIICQPHISAGTSLSCVLFNNSLSYCFIDAHLEHNNFCDEIDPSLGVTLSRLFYSFLGTS